MDLITPARVNRFAVSLTAASLALAACSDSVAPTLVVGVPAVDQMLTIRTLTPEGFNGGAADLCTTFATTRGRVRAVSEHAIVVSDSLAPAGFSAADYQAIAKEFDDLIYPADVSYFGQPTDLDNNGGRVILYYTPNVNKLTPEGTATTGGYVGGFFFAGDLFPTGDPPGCAASNRGEIFYLLAPDPAATFGNAFTVAQVRQLTRGTVAHEFQHMINAGGRYVGNADAFEVTWLDEGLSHFAEGVVGRAEIGLGDLDEIGESTLQNMSDADYTAFFAQNMARGKYYVLRPDTTGAIVNNRKAGDNLASRGAEWLLLRYAADWFSNDNPRALMRRLVAGPETGVDNFVEQTGVPLDTSLTRWLVTMYTDHFGIANLPARYNYRSYRMREVLTNTSRPGANGDYLPVTSLGGGVSHGTDVPPSSASYFVVEPATGARTVTVSDGSFTVGGGDAALSNLGTMAVGDVRVLTLGQAQDGLTIPSQAAAARYLVVLANVSGDTSGAIEHYTVRGTGVVASSATLAAANLMAPTQGRAMMTSVGGARGGAIEAALRAYERSRLRPSDQTVLPRGSVAPAPSRQVNAAAAGSGIRLCVVRIS